MKANPVILLKPTGEVAIPLDPADLLTLSQEATMQSLLAATLAAQTAQAQAFPRRAVFEPFHAANWVISGNNSSVYGGQMQAGEVDGTAVMIDLPASATLANSWCGTTQISGDVFGLVYETYLGAAPPGVWIDGVAYRVPEYPPSNPFGRVNMTKPKPRIPGHIIAKGLGDDRPHWVELMFPCHVTESRQWKLYGLLLDANAGYQPSAGPMGAIPETPVAVGIAHTALSTTTTTGEVTKGRGVRKFPFYNTTGAPITVTLSRTNSAAGNFWSTVVPANGSAEWDPGLILENQSYLYAIASAVGLVCAPVEVM